MSLKLDGRNPLAYMGVRPTRASAVILQNRQPTTNDYQNFDLGTWWIIPVDATFTQGEAWILTGKSNNSATWIQLDAGPTSGIVLTLTGDSGGAISPTSAGNINILGSGSISVAGSGNTLTVSSAGHSSINVQVFTSDDTYTPTAGMVSCVVECVGGGGAGAYAKFDGMNIIFGGGGGAGGYTRKIYDAATIGASQAVGVGAGGAGDTTANPANSGGDTTFLGMTAGGGAGSPDKATPAYYGAGGSASGGDINVPGQAGTIALQASVDLSGMGGSGLYGSGGAAQAPIGASNQVGNNGTGYGSGGGGAVSNTVNKEGGDGADGVVIVTEFIS